MFFAALGPGTWPSLCLECLLLTATSLSSEPHCFLFPSGKYKDPKATPYYRTSTQPTVFVLQVQICLLIAGWAVGFLRQDIFVLAFGVSSAWDDTASVRSVTWTVNHLLPNPKHVLTPLSSSVAQVLISAGLN